MNRVSRRAAILACAAVCSLSAAQPQRPFGDSEVFAPVPALGYPEGIAVKGNRVDLESCGAIPNHHSGARNARRILPRKLYVVEHFVGIVRMNLDKNNTQQLYAPFTPAGPSLLNNLAFDDFGNLFVTDSFAGTIYRVPAGGGAPQVWFQDPRLLGHPALPFGVNGIRIDKTPKKVYFSVTVDSNFAGVIYRLPLVSNPAPLSWRLSVSTRRLLLRGDRLRSPRTASHSDNRATCRCARRFQPDLHPSS